jgi:hypothetical protein
MNQDIEDSARMLYENIKADIDNASTRIEHIRISSLAQEALNLLTEIQKVVELGSQVVVDSPREEN